MIWSDEQVKAVKQMWLVDGMSASQIARSLNCGVTRNAVIGIIHRNSWQRPGVTAGARPSKPKSTKTREPRQPAQPRVNREEQLAQLREAAGAVVPMGPVDEFPSGQACRFIHGDPTKGHWQCCGHIVARGRSWCEHHLAVVYDKVRTEAANNRWRVRNTGAQVFQFSQFRKPVVSEVDSTAA